MAVARCAVHDMPISNKQSAPERIACQAGWVVIPEELTIMQIRRRREFALSWICLPENLECSFP